MSRNLSNLRIGHLNVRGLEHHIDGVKIILDKTQYHFFATTETKLKSSSPVGPIRVPGYNLIKHTLSTGRGRGTRTCGGIGLYVQKGIKAVPFLKSTPDPNVPLALRFEFLAVSARLNDLNICVVVVYNPSCSNPNFSSSNIKVRKPAAQTVLVRNMRGIDQLQLQAAFEEKDTRPFYDAVDVDAKVAWMGEEMSFYSGLPLKGA